MDAGTIPRHVVAICGGAVAGSEAARLLAEQGALVVVFEQNPRPYGKIEDGLPRWHAELRHKEYQRIDENLSAPGVLLVPMTGVGRDVELSLLTEELAMGTVILANGAWRDRPLAATIDAFRDRGLVYQNGLVHWFNHHQEPDYDGPRLEPSDGALIVGGGLASIDVAKILQLEVVGRALSGRGIHVDMLTLERRGTSAVLAQHGLSMAELGLRGATLLYRRRKQDMPLATAPAPTPERLAKLEATRTRIVDKVIDKYGVRLRELTVPVSPLEEDGRLAGLVVRRSEIRDGRVVEVEGTEEQLRSSLVVGSIGSIPEPIAGIPRRGELYDFESVDSGSLRGMDGVFGLGNVLTGKGNIRDSRNNASVIAERIAQHLLGIADAPLSIDELTGALHDEFGARAQPLVQLALTRPKLRPDRVQRILDWVEQRWRSVGYAGDYRSWRASHRPAA